MSAYTYDHNTAHILEPIQGYDLVSFMNFWAPLDKSVVDAVPGTVMSRNPEGKLIRGLGPESMAQFLYSKQDTEDVVNNPVTANSLEVTSISLNSFGDFRDKIIPPYHTNGWQSGASSNMGETAWTANGTAIPITFRPQTSVYTTFPGACGLEVASSEFAKEDANNDPVDYDYDEPLTSPLQADAASCGFKNPITINRGTDQDGGYLIPGKHYIDNICGIVSRKPFRNENGTDILCFWACHKPALNLSNLVGATSADSGKVLKVGKDGSITPESAT